MLERRLCYDDRWVIEIQQETTPPDAGGVLSFPDQATQLTLSLQLSQQQYTKLLSCVVVGSELAFPSESHQIQNDFLLMTEGGSMSCDDVADCIETSENVLAALLAQLQSNGFTPNYGNQSGAALPVLTTAQQGEGLLTGLTDCSNPATDMAIARAIVRELHESTLDAFEIFEYQTNIAEASGIALGFIPAGGTAANLVEFVDWMLETLVETYQAAYTQSAEDTIACAIFCHIQDACSLTYDDLLSIYETLGSLTVPALDDMAAVLQFAIDTAISIDTTGVAIWHYHLLQMIRFGETFGVSFNNIKQAMTAASTLLDYTYEDTCDDCPPSETPEDYWMLYTDFRTGMGQWVINQGVWTNSGVETLSYTGQSRAGVQVNNLGNEFQMLAAGVRSQRRGSGANGTNDFARYYAYQNINLSGTLVQPLSQSFISCNTNECDNQNVLVSATIPCESIYIQIGVEGAHVYPTNFGRIVEAVLYGLCNGTAKPPNSVYVAAVPPVNTLFPDQ